MPASDHTDDIMLVMTAAQVAEGQYLADLHVADTGTLPGAFEINLAIDVGTVGTCILCCPYQ